MSSQFSALVAKLKEVFQINRPDLDFGVYRILNARSGEIAEFLDKRLKEKVEQYLGEAKSSLDENVVKELQNELKAEYGKRAFNEQGELIDVEAIESSLGQKYLALIQSETNEMTDQSQVYSHLLTFFSRYYDEGDFISQRRYKGDTYAIPYAGEEVMLHWANKDQYYTKSGEMFSNFRFKLNEGRSVLFRLVSADTARENRKDNDKDRRFIIVTESKTFTRVDEDGEEFEETIVPFSIQNNELTILFEYAALPKNTKQDVLNHESHDKVISSDVLSAEWIADLQQLAPTEKEPKRTVLQKHLGTYTQKNTADYFIHKDLGKFLRHELDFYIKNEVMHLDDVVSADQFIQIERQLSIIKCLRQIGLEIVSFLASLEDFQKKLWLKKKFVVSSEYCITLDRVDVSLYAEIAANDKQWQQWESLGFKGKETGWGTVEYLKQHQALMVDTSLFDISFKASLLQKIDDLDAQTDGVIINSDNFQALNLLQERYKKQFDGVYIDPPYNTDASAIIYKNGFKDSSWLSLMESRISLSYNLAKKNSLCLTIDDVEASRIQLVLKDIYGNDGVLGVAAIKNNPSGRSTAKGFSIAHEYAIFCSDMDGFSLGRLNHTDAQIARYKFEDECGKFEWVNFRKHGGANANRYARPKLYYPIFIRSEEIYIPKMEWDVTSNSWRLLEDPSKNDIVIFPKTPNGEEKTWKWGIDTVKNNLSEFSVKPDQTNSLGVYLKARINEAGTLPLTIWDKKEYSSTEYGTNLLKKIFGESEKFSFPKSVHAVKDCLKVLNINSNSIVLDYFAGSGTTSHAVIDLNREDGISGYRKYVLVEQGEYFETVLKPRIKKVVYSEDWKEGKPTNPESGISHCLKVVKLESYEDTLNNLELVRKGGQQSLLDEQKVSDKPADKSAYNDYLMHYMLELESKDSLLNVKDFLKPFNYQMNITTDSAGAFDRKNIDLVETFNYLIGMNVQYADYQLDKGYVQITGKLRTGEYTTVLWRDCEKVGYTELDQLLAKLKINPNDGEYQLIYINGDHNVASRYTTKDGEEKQLKVRSIEHAFLTRMFEE